MQTTSPIDLPLPVGGGYHRPYTADKPESQADIRMLHTLPYCDLFEAIAEVLFPENEITLNNGTKTKIKARDIRADRYLLFRATWDPVFGTNLQLALMDLTDSCVNLHSGQHFVQLTSTKRAEFIELLSQGKLNPWQSLRRNVDPATDQRVLFDTIYKAITGGLFGEPGYGGNYRGIGWYYCNFTLLP